MYQVLPEPVTRIAPSLISYMRSFDDVWFGTLSETYDCWTEDSAALAPGQPPARRRARSHTGASRAPAWYLRKQER
jgi:hypothetical protein